MSAQASKDAVSGVADVADDVAGDVRANAEPAADGAAERIEAGAHAVGEETKRVADVASTQVRSGGTHERISADDEQH